MLNMGLTVVGLSRFQFGMTTIFHFFFVPFSIGMAFCVAVMESLYVIKKNEIYKTMAQFWGKIFLLSFAVGVVTGIIQEFQFGMNWSNYSRFMGDIFGAPLAIEALLAFFMESVFIGLWMFTWDRFQPKVHVIFIWMTFLGSMLSAIWILSANAFMQHPVGYKINEHTHRVQMTDFGALLSNPQLWKSFSHILFGALLTAAMVIVGMSAWGMLHNRDKDKPVFKKSMRVGLWISFISSLLVVFAGDLQTQQIITDQPMKFSATEGIYKDTGDPAPWTIVEKIDEKNHKAYDKIEVPYMLSILAYHKPSGSVKGMNTINKEMHKKYDHKFNKNHKKDYYVPTTTLFWSFRFMSAIGMVCMGLSFFGLLFTNSGHEYLYEARNKWMLYLLGWAMWIPFVANTCGWLITEQGRYPWIVYGLFTINDAVSSTATINNLLFSNITYFLLFACLGLVMVWYCKRTLNHGPYYEEEGKNIVTVDPLSKEAFE